jgi:hypothetical protein
MAYEVEAVDSCLPHNEVFGRASVFAPARSNMRVKKRGEQTNPTVGRASPFWRREERHPQRVPFRLGRS